MFKEVFEIKTEIISSEDYKKTYEVKRTWNEKGKKAIVLELYPIIGYGSDKKIDISNLHLLNHANDFGWGSVRVINLYSLVLKNKPSLKSLQYDKENVAYIEEVLEGKDIAEYDLVVATGNSMMKHKVTVETKLDILNMVREKKLGKQLKYIVTASMNKDKELGHHPLFLGLHYSDDKWILNDYPLEKEIARLEKIINKNLIKKEQKKGVKKRCIIG